MKIDNLISELKKHLKNIGLDNISCHSNQDFINFAKFSLRAAMGEFPSRYWRIVVKMRYSEIYDKFDKWIHRIRSDPRIREKLIRLLAENVVKKLSDTREIQIPYLPPTGIILDIGSGYLTFSKILISIALKNRRLRLFLIDLAEIPYKLATEVLRRVGSPENIVAMKASADQLPFNDNTVDAITLLGTFHELSRTVYYLELYRNIENIRLDSMRLGKVAHEYYSFIEEFHRVIKPKGILIIIDKVIDDYDDSFVRKIIGGFFKLLWRKKQSRKFTLVFQKADYQDYMRSNGFIPNNLKELPKVIRKASTKIKRAFLRSSDGAFRTGYCW